MEISFVGEPGANDGDLSVLFQWLQSNPKILRDCEMNLAASSPEGKMGGADLINMIVPNAVALANVAIAYATYRMQYQDQATAKLKTPNHTLVVVSDDPQQAAQVVAAVLAATGEGVDTTGPEKHATS